MKNTHDGKPIFWDGCLCEGDRMVPSDPATFILWTLCGKRDVPAGAAHVMRPEDKITCTACPTLAEAE